jgi:protein-tyrosine phosphatase
MFLWLLLVEILILVSPNLVKGLASTSKNPSCIGSLLLWRYSSDSFWRIVTFLSLGFLIVLISYAHSSSSLFLVWLIPSFIFLTLLLMVLFLTQTLSSLHRPLYLRSEFFLFLSLCNGIIFVFGIRLAMTHSWNWASQTLLICQGVEVFSFVLLVFTLAATWHMGRPYHKPFHESKTIETSQSHPYAIDFIDPEALSHHLHHSISTSSANSNSPPPLTIGMSYLPGRCRSNYQRNLNDDIERIQIFYGIDLVISLLPRHQLEEMKVSNLEEAFKEHKLNSFLFGWRDKWIPSETSLHDLVEVVELIVQNLLTGRRVLVHCFGGKGRTGVIIVSVLIRLGVPYPIAIDLIRTSRKGCIHNPLQLFYLNWINNYFAQDATHVD